jgi:PII-like signaling protein
MTNGLPTAKKKMLKLQVIVRNGDRSNGKNIVDSLFSLYDKSGISGATAWMGTRGYGSRGVARAEIVALSIKLPVVVETVDLPERLEPLLPRVKEIVGDIGLVTVEEVIVL